MDIFNYWLTHITLTKKVKKNYVEIDMVITLIMLHFIFQPEPQKV